SLHLHLSDSRLAPMNPLLQYILDILCFWSSQLLVIGRTPRGSVLTYSSFQLPIIPRPERIRLHLGVIHARVRSVPDIVLVTSIPLITSFSVIALRAPIFLVFHGSVYAHSFFSSSSYRSMGVFVFVFFGYV